MKNPSYYVFFDVDGTLLREKSLFEFLQYFYKVNYGKLWKIKYKSYLLLNNFYDFLSVNRSWINQNYHKQYKGHQQNKIDALGYEWFFYIQNKSKHLFNMDVINELKRHKARGAAIVFVSGSFLPCLKPLAKYLGVEHILTSKPEIKAGKYTGKLLSPPMIGDTKAIAIKKFLAEKMGSISQICFAYGDHSSDIPMLSAVGNPRVVAGNRKLEQHAKKNGWLIIYLQDK